MNHAPQRITLDEWDEQYARLRNAGMTEPNYGGPLKRHLDDGDLRLEDLRYDNSAACLRLWNFLLTEEERLREARGQSEKLVGAMKDLGTIPIMAYSLPGMRAFYPDGAWWIPCIMELEAGLLHIADNLGIDESFCPVRAMLGAFVTGAHFPLPDLLTCSVGATCDDFSAIAQRLQGLGHPILWWEIPHCRKPDPGEEQVLLPGGMAAPASQKDFVTGELERVKRGIEKLAGSRLDDLALAAGIRKANQIRKILAELRRMTFTARTCPLPALELMIAEMLALHFCSDRDECHRVLADLLGMVKARTRSEQGYFAQDAVRVFWINPVADLRAMNLLEDCGARLCGTDFMFTHALDQIPENLPPMEALACMALADPMAGPASRRAGRICRDVQDFGAEALIISRIPGASHCVHEGEIIKQEVSARLGIPCVEIEVPPVSDAMLSALTNRIQALVEIARGQR